MVFKKTGIKKPTIICPNCGKEFEILTCDIGRRKYCSRKCMHIHTVPIFREITDLRNQEAWMVVTCENELCKKRFVKKKAQVKRFCCYKCSKDVLKKDYKEKVEQLKEKEKKDEINKNIWSLNKKN